MYDPGAMPWRCPACHLPINHNEFEVKPRVGSKYRCHICRLELVLDDDADKLVVAPLTGDEPRRPADGPIKRSP